MLEMQQPFLKRELQFKKNKLDLNERSNLYRNFEAILRIVSFVLNDVVVVSSKNGRCMFNIREAHQNNSPMSSPNDKLPHSSCSSSYEESLDEFLRDNIRSKWATSWSVNFDRNVILL